MKTAVRSHFAPTGIDKIKKKDINKYGQRCGGIRTLKHIFIAGKSYEMVQSLWKTV